MPIFEEDHVMLKRFLKVAVLTVGLMLSIGAGHLLAECYQECTMVVGNNYTILSCGPVWCD